MPSCRVLVENVSEAEYDDAAQSYDVYRQSLTGNRIALTDTNIMSLALKYAKSLVPKYQVVLETAVLFLLSMRRYFFDARMTKYAGTPVPLAAHMCAPRLGFVSIAPRRVCALQLPRSSATLIL